MQAVLRNQAEKDKFLDKVAEMDPEGYRPMKVPDKYPVLVIYHPCDETGGGYIEGLYRERLIEVLNEMND